MTLPSRPVAAHPAPVNIRRSQPPPTPPAALYRQIYDLSPGVDETPYMRFAIEQLTRDEELMGRGRQGSIDDTDYPVERIVPDEGLGYYTASAGQAQAPEPPKKPAPTSIRNNKRPGKQKSTNAQASTDND